MSNYKPVRNDDNGVNAIADYAKAHPIFPDLIQFNDCSNKDSCDESLRSDRAKEHTRALEDKGLLFSLSLIESTGDDKKYTGGNSALRGKGFSGGSLTESLKCETDYEHEFSGIDTIGREASERIVVPKMDRTTPGYDDEAKIKDLEARLAVQTEKLAKLLAPDPMRDVEIIDGVEMRVRSTNLKAPGDGSHYVFDQSGNGQLVGPNGERQYNLIDGKMVWIDSKNRETNDRSRSNSFPEHQGCTNGSCSSCRAKPAIDVPVIEQLKNTHLAPVHNSCSDGSCANCQAKPMVKDTYEQNSRSSYFIPERPSCANGSCGSCGSCRPKSRRIFR